MFFFHQYSSVHTNISFYFLVFCFYFFTIFGKLLIFFSKSNSSLHWIPFILTYSRASLLQFSLFLLPDYFFPLHWIAPIDLKTRAQVSILKVPCYDPHHSSATKVIETVVYTLTPPFSTLSLLFSFFLKPYPVTPTTSVIIHLSRSLISSCYLTWPAVLR